jgi:hypothetical protein
VATDEPDASCCGVLLFVGAIGFRQLPSVEIWGIDFGDGAKTSAPKHRLHLRPWPDVVFHLVPPIVVEFLELRVIVAGSESPVMPPLQRGRVIQMLAIELTDKHHAAGMTQPLEGACGVILAMEMVQRHAREHEIERRLIEIFETAGNDSLARCRVRVGAKHIELTGESIDERSIPAANLQHTGTWLGVCTDPSHHRSKIDGVLGLVQQHPPMLPPQPITPMAARSGRCVGGQTFHDCPEAVGLVVRPLRVGSDDAAVTQRRVHAEKVAPGRYGRAMSEGVLLDQLMANAWPPEVTEFVGLHEYSYFALQ